MTADKRCPWCLGSPEYVAYHDREWGRPVHDDLVLFEFLVLEGAQAGLSWSTILRKRGNYRRLFAGFDPAKVESVVLTGIKDAYEKGSAVDYAVESKTLPQIDIPQVFRVEVKKPGGDLCRLYARNLHAPNGKAQGAFTLALNDVAGDWTITVTDVASGKTTQKSFSVKQKDR